MQGGMVPVEKSEAVGDPVPVVPPASKMPRNLQRKTRMHKEVVAGSPVRAVISPDVIVRPPSAYQVGRSVPWPLW